MTKDSQKVRAAGYSSKKEHWQFVKRHGTQTSCKVKLSYSGNNNKDFYHVAKNYPELCCLKCIDNFREFVKLQLSLKHKTS